VSLTIKLYDKVRYLVLGFVASLATTIKIGVVPFMAYSLISLLIITMITSSSFSFLPKVSALAPEDPNIIPVDSEYSDSNLNFKIQYPSRFTKLHDDPITGGPVVWFRYEIPPNPEYNGDSSHTLRIPLNVYQLSQGDTFETIRAHLLTTWLSQNFKTTADLLFNYAEGPAKTFQGNQAYILQYSVRQAGVGDEYAVQNIFTIVGDKAYVLSYVVAQIDHAVIGQLAPNNFVRYYRIFEKMWNSLCFPINPGATTQCPRGGGGGPLPPPRSNATTTVTEEWVNPNYRDLSTNYGVLYKVAITCKTSSSEYRDFCAKDAGKIKQVRIFAGNPCMSDIQKCDLGMTENIAPPNPICITLPRCPYIWEAKAMSNDGSTEVWKLQALPSDSSKAKVSFNHQYSAEINFGGIYDLVYDKTTICNGTICRQQAPLITTTTPGSNTTGTTNSIPANVTEQQPPQQLPPEALDQQVETTMNTPVDITLQASDANPTDELTAEIVSPPSNGQLSEFDQTTGTVSYTPEQEYTGEDSFTFNVNDGISHSNTATVSITVSDGDGMEPSDSGGCAFGSAADPITGECIPQTGLTQCPPGMQVDEFNQCMSIEGQEEPQTQQPPPFEETFPEGVQPPSDDGGSDGSTGDVGTTTGTNPNTGMNTTTADTDSTTLDQDFDGYSPATGDCDDSNPSTSPAAMEFADGLDNNCDGAIDNVM